MIRIIDSRIHRKIIFRSYHLIVVLAGIVYLILHRNQPTSAHIMFTQLTVLLSTVVGLLSFKVKESLFVNMTYITIISSTISTSIVAGHYSKYHVSWFFFGSLMYMMSRMFYHTTPYIIHNIVTALCVLGVFLTSYSVVSWGMLGGMLTFVAISVSTSFLLKHDIDIHGNILDMMEHNKNEWTRKAETEKRLAKKANFYHQILEEITTQVAILDLDARYIYLNPAGILNPQLRRWAINKDDVAYFEKCGMDVGIAGIRKEWIRKCILENRRVDFIEDFDIGTDRQEHFHRIYSPLRDRHGNVTSVMMIGYKSPLSCLKSEYCDSAKLGIR